MAAAALATFLTLVVSVATASAATGTIAGRLGGLPRSAEFGAVEAIDARGEIRGVALTSPSGRYDLKVPPGTYVLAGSGTTESAAFSSISPPKKVKKSSRVRVSSTLESSPLARVAATKGLIPKGSILAIEGVLWRVAEGPELNLGSYVLNDLLRTCVDHGMFFVAAPGENEKIVMAEKALADSGRASPPFDYRPRHPQYLVVGVGEAQAPESPGEGFHYSLELGLSTAAHLGVNAARVEVTAVSPGYDRDILTELIAEATAQFTAKVCG
ncbi:MAG: hypothetical protein QM729_12180 [Solirubrobacterales bacterium]